MQLKWNSSLSLLNFNGKCWWHWWFSLKYNCLFGDRNKRFITINTIQNLEPIYILTVYLPEIHFNNPSPQTLYGLLLKGFPTKTVHVFPYFHILVTYLVIVIALHGEPCKPQSFLLCIILHSPLTSSLTKFKYFHCHFVFKYLKFMFSPHI
jgi:hypothetical protein